MKYIIKYLFFSILLLCGIFLFLLTSTQKALVLELRYISHFVPGIIKIEHVSGTLFSAFTLKHISYEYAGKQFTIESIDIKWHPAKLLVGKLDIDTLSVKNTTLQLGAESSENNTTMIDLHSLRSSLDSLHFVRFKQFIIDNMSIQKGQQFIHLTGKLDENWNFQWYFKCLDGSLTKGYWQGNGKLIGARFQPTISTLIEGSNIKINDYYFKKIIINSNAAAKKIKNEWLMTLRLIVNQDFTLGAAVSFPEFNGSLMNQPMNGKIHFTAADLSLLTQLLPDVKNPHGVLNGQVILQGTLKKPLYKMTLALENGRFNFPMLGLQPNNVRAQGQMDNSLNLEFTGTFQSGIGTAKLQGSCDFGQSGLPLTLAIQGNNLTIIHLSEYHVTASPNISLLLTYPSITVTGKVLISEASMIPKNITTAVTLPDEVIFVDQQKAIPIVASPIQLTIHLSLELGENVNIDYNNLKAKLLGHMTVSKTPGSLAQASGELYTTQGQYTAYGQKLAISTGRLIYTGNSLMNPGLDIRATKKVKRVVTQNANAFTTNTALQNIPIATEMSTVGVQVLGTADNPKISLFSIPADLSQSDILSYLLIGVPQSQASGAQGSLLLTALSAYNPDANHMMGITNKLQQSLGLSELNVASIETFNPTTQTVESTTSAVVGKQITEKLSIHYSIGLFNPISILSVKYQMNSHWSIQSETSSIDSGADILYGFERD
jgi:translocation and assembly module TamB